jgi:UDP-2,3-diacylglucosamine pyrophosphatase LpxH
VTDLTATKPTGPGFEPPAGIAGQERTRMLAIVSDLHLNDGSTASNPHGAAFTLLGKEIEAAADAKRAKEIHLVLLGDIMDLVRTDWWHRNNVPPEQRPWGGDLDPEYAMNANATAIEGQYGAILDDVLAGAPTRDLLGMIDRLQRPGGLPVHVTYVVGNHDRVFNNFDGLKTRLRGALPRLNLTFDTRLVAPEYRLLARHGHEWDDHCHGWIFMTKVLKKNRRAGRFDPAAYRVMAIGEVVTAELMSGFIHHVKRRLDAQDPDDQAFLELLKDVNNLRPMTDVLKWLGWATRGKVKRYVAAAEAALVLALDGLLDSAFAKQWDSIKPDLLFWGDLTDYLSRVRWALKKEGLASVYRDATTLSKLAERPKAVYNAATGKGDRDRYERGAEADLKNAGRDIRCIVYGHTHRALRRCFAADPAGQAQLYLNTGTYLPLVERAEDGKSFWQAHRMAVLLVFRDDEDTANRRGQGPTLDVWDGVRVKQYVT